MKYANTLDNEILSLEEGNDPVKVAILDKDGKLRMGKGFAEKRGSVEAFLEEREKVMTELDQELNKTLKRATPHMATDAKAYVYEKIAVQFEPRIAGAPPQDHRGDKTPEFARWLIANRPEQAAKLYAGIWSLNPKFPD